MITINSKNNTYYHCDYIHKEIPAPVPKRYKVNVPLRDGELDVTSYLSSNVFYETRQVIIGLELRGLRTDWPSYISTLMNDIHGKEVTYSFDEDPGWQWHGYASVTSIEDHGASCGIQLTIATDPFKRKTTETLAVNTTISGDQNFTLTITDPRAYLRFETGAADFTVTYDSQTWTLPSGSSTAYGLFLTAGTHTLAVHGAGTLKIYTTGGSL